jgi:hypothetical protein
MVTVPDRSFDEPDFFFGFRLGRRGRRGSGFSWRATPGFRDESSATCGERGSAATRSRTGLRSGLVAAMAPVLPPPTPTNVASDRRNRVRSFYGDPAYARLVAVKRRWDPHHAVGYSDNQNIEPSAPNRRPGRWYRLSARPTTREREEV